MSYDYFDNLPNEAKTRYKMKLELAGLDQCPYKEPAGKWLDDIQKWPDVTYGDVYFYLIESPGPFDRKAMKNWRSLDSYKAVVQGWVQEVKFLKAKDSQVFSAPVRHSQRMNETPCKPWAAIDSSGCILAGHCNCMAGLGESCTHLGALLWKLELAVRMGHTKETACTAEACAWNVDFVKKITPEPIHRIKFFSSSSTGGSQSRRKRGMNDVPLPSDDDQAAFLSQLSEVSPTSIALSMFQQSCDVWKMSRPTPPAAEVAPDVTVPLPLSSLYSDENKDMDENVLQEKIQDLITCTEEQVEYLEEITRAQASSLTWKQQRVGRITASVAHSVLHTNIDHPAKSLIRSICSTASDVNTDAIRWGKDNKINCLQEYETRGQECHDNLKVEKTGLRLSPDRPYLGASPDGRVVCDCHSPKLLEVKCPYRFRDMTEEDASSVKDFPVDENGVKTNHKYYTQVQMQLFVWEMDACDLLIWTPTWLKVVNISRDTSFISNMVDICSKFFSLHLLPELLTHSHIDYLKQLEQTDEAAEAASAELEEVYCTCKTHQNSKLIGCDGANCAVEWYHLKCVGLKRVPKGEWLCKSCKSKISEKQYCLLTIYCFFV